MGICDYDGVGDNKHQPTAITSAILELIMKSGCAVVCFISRISLR